MGLLLSTAARDICRAAVGVLDLFCIASFVAVVLLLAAGGSAAGVSGYVIAEVPCAASSLLRRALHWSRGEVLRSSSVLAKTANMLLI